jgi:hypothetical protein
VFAGLIVAFVIVVVALLVATLGALGVAAIGWLLSRWFELSQWQGTLIALAVALSVGAGVYKVATGSDTPGEPEWIEWDDADEAATSEPPIVPWRRQRPTQGDLPADRPSKRGSQRKQS